MNNSGLIEEVSTSHAGSIYKLTELGRTI